ISPHWPQSAGNDCGNDANRIATSTAASGLWSTIAMSGETLALVGCSAKGLTSQVWSTPPFLTPGKRNERGHKMLNMSIHSHTNNHGHGPENVALLQNDPSNCRTASNEPLSEAARVEIVRCLRDVQVDNVIWRRRVRRAGWDVLRHWEIWGLDVQEI